MTKRQRAKLVATLLEELEKHGIAKVACKKAGLSTAQYYRWLKDNPEFAKQADAALDIGRREMNDLARSRLFQKIDQGESWAIRYHLSRRDPEYKLPPERIGIPVAPEKDALVAASYDLLASALAAGDIKAAKFILERLDIDLMRPKDQVLLKNIEAKEEMKEQLEHTRQLLIKLTEGEIPDPTEQA